MPWPGCVAIVKVLRGAGRAITLADKAARGQTSILGCIRRDYARKAHGAGELQMLRPP